MQRAPEDPRGRTYPARSLDQAGGAPAAQPADVARSRAGFFPSGRADRTTNVSGAAAGQAGPPASQQAGPPASRGPRGVRYGQA